MTVQMSAVPTKGLIYTSYFTKEDPYSKIEWATRDAIITGADGKAHFEQLGIEVPASWSQNAINVVASKYFRGHLGTPERENSVKQLINRVAHTITDWGFNSGYFASSDSAQAFNLDLKHLLVNQMMAFNSPVWFNVGVEKKPQCSACFINSIEDSMESIMGLAKTEALLFKWGSGTGTNLSNLRGSMEKLRGGGTASGPVSFMKGFDAFAGVIKSGGKTRRAAKMVILDVDHPDIEEFIWCKAKEEKKAHALIDAGYDGSFTGEAYGTVSFQNANNSVRVTDDFMSSIERDEEVCLVSRTDKKVIKMVPAKKIWDQIAEAAHQCGDPGLQFDTTINDWHTCLNTSRINASNPCSEYMFVDDSACNLASLNLRKFQKQDGSFDFDSFSRAVRLTIIAQEILVGRASYPTPKIEENSHRFRPLGLGYANLGALLMSMGVPYDSDQGRATAAFITSIMSAQAYMTSGEIAAQLGPCAGFEDNSTSFLHVITKHRAAHEKIGWQNDPMFAKGRQLWDAALAVGKQFGFRNSQVTVLAPTGTIGFMMDCDTTGIEPDIALVKYKKLVGGGDMSIVNQSIPAALEKLGYGFTEAKGILDYVLQHGTVEGCKDLKKAHLPIFDCAFKSGHGERTIHWEGHVKMMAAVQPFLSGAISKTVNLPNSATVDDIKQAYMMAWETGLKAIAVYRDGCKRSQPLTTKKKEEEVQVAPAPKGLEWGQKKRLPDTRDAKTHKFNIGGQKGYVTVGLYEDGTPGEIFIEVAKAGSFLNGVLDSFAKALSTALKVGAPFDDLYDKFVDTRFDPSGITSNPDIQFCSSLPDYIVKWMKKEFYSKKEAAQTLTEQEPALPILSIRAAKVTPRIGYDGPPCTNCGSPTRRAGTCFVCDCGTTSGCG